MRVRIRPALLLLLLLPVAALAQSPPASTVRSLLAAGRIGSVVDTPLHFRLFRVAVPAAQRLTYTGPNAVLYALSGTLAIGTDGSDQTVAEGAGALIPAGRTAAIRASRDEPAGFLLFVLSPAAEMGKQLLQPAGAAEELYRTPEPLPGLKPGPYEFSLTRVALPVGMPANPPHYRSGAALYYILAGAGLFIAEGKTAPRTAGMPHFEPAGLVHQWANPGDNSLVLLQANISQEGIPAVLAK
jgi:quercetin dioxygenase-like cupin family protein